MSMKLDFIIDPEIKFITHISEEVTDEEQERFTVNEFGQWLMNRFDDRDLIVYENAAHRHHLFPDILEMINGWDISARVAASLKEGTITTEKGHIWLCSQQILGELK